ncbi:uncharacterized protein [Drosophila bipectinata]|uniref:uncharacterized protein n=1 Tax=Drosophila bipectinata TaxID=42026 RepID=UPI0007E6A76F|nr:uncharacterized protein LOC108126758 [Drosophila bipectinata]
MFAGHHGNSRALSEPEIFGIPPDQKISHAGRVYGLSVVLAGVALSQWLILGWCDVGVDRTHEERYGWWLVCTFFAVVILAWTQVGRKVPFNYIIIACIVESSTVYIALEQTNSKNGLVNFYAGVVVVALMLASIFWGAYFPMFIVPGDLVLSILVAIANIMMILFFINAFFIHYQGIFTAVRNTFAVVAVCMVMYTATIIHDRQFDVPKNEYLFLSVLQFFSYMILHERILTLANQNSQHTVECLH